MFIIGAHMSIAGGLHKAITAAVALKMDTVQIFTHSPSQWAVKPSDSKSNHSDQQDGWTFKPISHEDVQLWQAAWRTSKLQHPIAHASYLINLAAPKDDLWYKSIAAMVGELHRAEQLGLSGVVVHPGAFTTSDEASGLQRIIDGVVEVLRRQPAGTARLLLENTAGQGSCLGWSIEQLGKMLAGIDQPERLGICFDTCHALAAGYDLTCPSGFAELRRLIDLLLPTGSLRAVHVNDSKAACGKRVDRHEHIGCGYLGDEGFRLLLADDLIASLPMYLETEKGIDKESGEDWDMINLRRLRGLTP